MNHHHPQKKFLTRRKTAALAAFTIALSMLLTGTFAWSSMSQRATNPLEGNNNHGGRIHDHFDGENKDVFAENFGNAPVFVRIMLKEFMEINGESFCDDAVRANPSTWTTHIPSTSVNVCEGVEDGNGRFHDYITWTMGGTTYFMPTFNQRRDNNETDTSGRGIDFITGGQTADYERDSDGEENDGSANFWQSGDTSTGTLHYTDAAGNPAQEAGVTHTAQSTLTPMDGTNGGVITMAQWIAMDRPVGNVWVIDTDGWAYWASPLAPGAATSLLLDEISMLEPDGEWFYAIHVIGEFASAFGLTDWENSDFGAPSTAANELLDLIAPNRQPATPPTTEEEEDDTP